MKSSKQVTTWATTCPDLPNPLPLPAISNPSKLASATALVHLTSASSHRLTVLRQAICAHRLSCAVAALQDVMANVPSDVYPTIARAALAAEGNTLATWLRLSMVSRTWRESVAGVCRLSA